MTAPMSQNTFFLNLILLLRKHEGYAFTRFHVANNSNRFLSTKQKDNTRNHYIVVNNGKQLDNLLHSFVILDKYCSTQSSQTYSQYNYKHKLKTTNTDRSINQRYTDMKKLINWEQAILRHDGIDPWPSSCISPLLGTHHYNVHQVLEYSIGFVHVKIYFKKRFR